MPASKHREPEEGLMVALRSIRPQEHLWLKDQCLLGAYMLGENRVWHVKPAWMVLWVVHWGRSHCISSCLGCCRPTFNSFGFNFVGLFYLSLCV